MSETPQKRFTVAIDPQLYTACALAARRNGLRIGDMLDDALRRHPQVKLALDAMAMIEGPANGPDAQEGGSKT